jgi:serine/threonine-protein kinase
MGTYGSFETHLADRYRFESVLGRGGIGTVYRATDLQLGRSVAIKLLQPVLTTEVGIKRFQREIQITATLHHPSILTVLDSGEVDGRLYYVMEDIGGESLRGRLARDGHLSIEDALAIAQRVAGGLQYAHDRGVVHRDIKPGNIILADGRACIVDFGVARIVNDAGSQQLTESGITVGTPEYLSPEQAGAEKQVGPRADQYGLACVLFEMLTGSPPFTGPTPTAVSMRHVNDPPPRLQSLRGDAPQALGDAIARALRKAPEERFDSVLEFMAAASASSGTGTGAPDPPTQGTHRSLVEVFKSLWTTASAVVRPGAQ